MKVRGLLCWLLTLHSFPAFSADNTGPRLVSARVAEWDATNFIYLELSEPVISTTSRNTNNYTVTLFGSTNRVPVTSALFFSAPPTIPPTIRLRVATNNWHLGGVSNYYVTVNNLQDFASNNIAPNSRVGISWPRYAELLGPGSVWHYQAYPDIEPNLLDQRWTSCDFRESRWWQEGLGPFECASLGDCYFGPAFFRTSFVCPPDYAAAGRLRLAYLVDAAAVFYLNGVELGRVNLCDPPYQLSGGTPCCVNFIIAPPVRGGGEVAVTNLLAGTNWLAVAVLPCTCLPVSYCIGSGLFGISFDLNLRAVRYVAGPLPVEDLPVLKTQWLPDNRVQLSWLGSGYALEVATNLPPAGRWVEVSDMSNPYALSIQPNSSRFFRLRR